MITNPSVREKVIQNLLIGHGGGTKTAGSIDLFSEDFRNDVFQDFDLDSGEKILLASRRGPNYWCLLTSERLIFRNEEITRGMYPWSAVLSVDPPQKWSQVERGELSKEAITQLTVKTSDGVRHLLEFDDWRSTSLVWSALLRLKNDESVPTR